MENVKQSRGFTLIELLVVVLIIGILAAVAVPQYQKAVVKSRVGSILSLGASLAAAQEAYYLANGKYAWQVSDLDVDVPSSCTHLDLPSYDEEGEILTCGKYFLVDNDSLGSVNIHYCPDNNTSWNDCYAKRDFQIAVRLQHWKKPVDAGKRKCLVVNNSALGETICSNLAGFSYQSY